MAIGEITGSNPIVSSVPGSRQGGGLRRASRQPGGATPATATPAAPPNVNSIRAEPLQNVTAAAVAQPEALPAKAPVAVPAEVAAAPEVEAIRQNALLINETLRNLNFTATATTDTLTGTLLFNTRSPFLTALQATQALTPLQQNALLVNQALQNLNFEPAEPENVLLIDELPPSLEAAEITGELNLVQQTALLVNETLQDLGVGPQAGATEQPLPAAAQAVAVTEEEAGGALTATVLLPAENLTLAERGLAGGVAAAAPATPPAAATAAVTAVPEAVTVFSQGFTAATLPTTVFPDRTPYVLAVYQLNAPAPRPAIPAPIGKDVPSTAEVARIWPVGNARLRRALPRGREGGRTGNIEYNTTQPPMVQAERAIRHTIGQINADLAAHGQPLHLVFAKHEEGFALDVYDCSYAEACRVSYDVPISLDKLTDVLDNLEHETGVIVDKES